MLPNLLDDEEDDEDMKDSGVEYYANSADQKIQKLRVM
jgi:hypothetical protein